MTTDQIRTAALKLDPAEREALAEELLLSLTDADRQDIDNAWLAEAYRRNAVFAANKSTATPADEFFNRITNRKPL